MMPHSLTCYRIAIVFQRTFAMNVACQQRTHTPPDTWPCPTMGIACVVMLRPIICKLVHVMFPNSEFQTYLGTSISLKYNQSSLYIYLFTIYLGRCHALFNLHKFYRVARKIKQGATSSGTKVLTIVTLAPAEQRRCRLKLRHLKFDPYPSRTRAGPRVTLVATHATMHMS